VQGTAGGPRRPNLGRLRRRRKQRKSRFSPQNGRGGRYNNSLFQPFTQQIRYLADQRKFFADQRIQTGLSAE
jgi:hypothetical protein